MAAFCIAPARAREAGHLGLGLGLGDPTGARAKYWISKRQALDFGLGVSESLTVHGDYVWHGWNALPQPKRGDLGAYVGAGWRVETRADTHFGFRGVLGLSYWPKFKRPVEFFFELAPVWRVEPKGGARVDGGVGLRYYFAPAS